MGESAATKLASALEWKVLLVQAFVVQALALVRMRDS
jgi:hypothetical protein